MSHRGARAALLAAVSLAALGAIPAAARADDTDAKLGAIERQIQALQAELQHMKHDLAAKTAELEATKARSMKTEAALQSLPAATLSPRTTPTIPPGYALLPGNTAGSYTLAKLEPPGPKLPPGTFKVRGVTITLGGFIETTGIYRSRNETADIASNFNTGIPLPNSPSYHENELRFTPRQSRVSLLATAAPDPVTKVTAYGEFDFQGAAPTANSVESNSYNPRVRHLYAMYDRSDLGLHVLAGQTWSLLTMSKLGIDGTQADMNIPMQIDAQYIPGFTWARQPQFRIAKDWGKTFWLAASVENPQVNYYTGPNGLAPSSTGTVIVTNPGGSGFFSGTNYSNDYAPDIVLKAAYDQPFAHLEAYGVARFMHDRVSTLGSGSNKTVIAGGGGAAMLLHLVPKLVDLQGSFLAGDGIGRYGTGQLPDATVGANGAPVPLPEVQALAGLTGHPAPNVDLYAYGGLESIGKSSFAAKDKGYGYGSPLYDNAGCETELAPASQCVGNTSSIAQGTVGAWWKVLHSPDFGSVQVGMQYSYTHRAIFQGVGPTPRTDDNMVFFSIRVFPFQDTAPSAPPIY